MKFTIKKRDGPARGGNVVLNECVIFTPNIFFVTSSRVQKPDYSEIVITNKFNEIKEPILIIGDSVFSSLSKRKRKKLSVDNYLIYPKDAPFELHLHSLQFIKKDNECCIIPANTDVIDDFLKKNCASLYIISHTKQLFSQPVKFVEFITKLRSKIGYQRMIYTPYIGEPCSLALLTYMGIDFYDTTSAILSAREQIMQFPTGNLHVKDITEVPCSCPSCNKIKGNISKSHFSQIVNHNYYTLVDEIKLIRSAIVNGNLRELVETRVRARPELVSVLKILDFQYNTYLEERTPIFRKNKLLATSKESLFRPEVKRFQERVRVRYQKPPSAKVLLLLPCSAKKPYSFSKSHKLFQESIIQAKNSHVIHEVIITSPLGVVPRELELVYPASLYDIAVTGHWDEDEKKIIRNVLNTYLEKNKYEKIILHVPLSIQNFIIDLFDNPIITCFEKPTSKESLHNLVLILKDITHGYEKVCSIEKTYQNIFAIASYQFGKKITNVLLKNCKIKGKYPYQKIFDSNKQLGMITKERGFISLTLDGAKKIAHCKEFWVEIYNDFTVRGSIFAPGIKNADESIRIGDEVIVIQDHEICGVGVAQMNGTEMKENTRGEAVKIRHKI
jgi:archaeosine synthase